MLRWNINVKNKKNKKKKKERGDEKRGEMEQFKVKKLILLAVELISAQ